MRLVERLRAPVAERQSPLSLDEWANYFTYAGNSYPYGLRQTSPGQAEEPIGRDFVSLARGAYCSSGPVFALMACRMLLFSEARFQWRQVRSGRPGALFGTPELSILEHPWTNGTTGDLLARAITDADLAGNAFFLRSGDRLVRLRPDWVSIVIESAAQTSTEVEDDPDVRIAGYVYRPGGPNSGRPAQAYLADEVAHFAPIPDPLARYRGMSWLTPVLREVMGDKAAISHKLTFFENGATPNLAVKLDTTSTEAFDQWVEKFKAAHEGAANAYKTLFLGMGADVTPIGVDLKGLDYKAVQGAGETRLAAAAGVPPIIAGFSEGLASATYSNYTQARRRFADGTMRPLWRNIAGSLSSIVAVPSTAELWYDDRDIPFLREDEKDAADTLTSQASAVKLLLDAGYEPDAAVDAVTSNDLERLKGKHSGLSSVQLQPIGAVTSPEAPPNGEVDPKLELGGVTP